jgi:hypothetical protein
MDEIYAALLTMRKEVFEPQRSVDMYYVNPQRLPGDLIRSSWIHCGGVWMFG